MFYGQRGQHDSTFRYDLTSLCVCLQIIVCHFSPLGQGCLRHVIYERFNHMASGVLQANCIPGYDPHSSVSYNLPECSPHLDFKISINNLN